MKIRTLITFVLIFSFYSQAFATAQASDRLVYKGDTISIFSNPLEQHSDIDSLRLKKFGLEWMFMNTACWRGYIAEWKIEDDQLYLIGIFGDKSRADLAGLFGAKFIDGKVKADWVSANILSPQGKEIHNTNSGYEAYYERELEFHIEKGKLIGTTLHDNSKSKKSVYNENPEILKEFIYSNIQWESLPEQDSVIRVFVGVAGTLDSARVVRGYNEIYDQEAIRVVKSIPEWSVYFRRGKVVPEA